MQEYDYHGLSVRDALSHFISDYYDELYSRALSKVFRIVHGYGSTGHGGTIKKAIRKLLTFEMSHGTLTFTVSEHISSHSGYSLVAPIYTLQPVPIGFFSPLGLNRPHLLVRTINTGIERGEHAKNSNPVRKKRTCEINVPEKFGTLDPSALNALNQILPPDSK